MRRWKVADHIQGSGLTEDPEGHLVLYEDVAHLLDHWVPFEDLGLATDPNGNKAYATRGPSGNIYYTPFAEDITSEQRLKSDEAQMSEEEVLELHRQFGITRPKKPTFHDYVISKHGSYPPGKYIEGMRLDDSYQELCERFAEWVEM